MLMTVLRSVSIQLSLPTFPLRNKSQDIIAGESSSGDKLSCQEIDRLIMWFNMIRVNVICWFPKFLPALHVQVQSAQFIL